MKIDLLYEIQIALPHGPTTERDYFWRALEQVEAADRAGFGCAWAVEHHFQTEFAHSSAPRGLPRHLRDAHRRALRREREAGC